MLPVVAFSVEVDDEPGAFVEPGVDEVVVAAVEAVVVLLDEVVDEQAVTTPNADTHSTTNQRCFMRSPSVAPVA